MTYDDPREFRLTYICAAHAIPIEIDSACEACQVGLAAAPPMFLTLFSARNKHRSETSFGKLTDLPVVWWTNALNGEAGEAANIAKKMSRLTMVGTSWNKPEDQDLEQLRQRLMREVGDVMIYADLLAARIGTTSAECIKLAFNEKSDQIGSDIVI